MVMAHGMKAKPGDGGSPTTASAAAAGKTGIGSRRIFPPQFKLQVLDSYRRDADCKGNQRATARKYGIHRRQIQKWLQAEGNLRNSVVSAASNNNNCILANKNAAPSECGAPADISIQRRSPPVRPVLSPAMATQTPADRPRCPASPADIASPARAHAHHMPMDLSVRRPTAAAAAPATPSLPAPRPVASASASRSPSPASYRSRSRSPRARTQSVIMTPTSSSCSSPPHAEIWDLSKPSSTEFKINAKTRCQPPADNAAAKPLFKPYLLDAGEDKPGGGGAATPFGCYAADYPASTYYAYGSATLYDAGVDVGYVFDESGVLQPATYLRQLPFAATHTHQPPPPHQRNAYPLDFKLRAIDSYYRDEYCKGNQRAVAVKYNVHRRQVQKWLKQEEDLREREQHTVT